MNNNPFTVELLSFAKKDLKELWQIEEKVLKVLVELEQSPQKGHDLSNNLQGIKSFDFTVKGSGQYRVAYFMFEDEKKCSVIAVRVHENFYDIVAKRVKFLQSFVEKARALKQTSGKAPKKH